MRATAVRYLYAKGRGEGRGMREGEGEKLPNVSKYALILSTNRSLAPVIGW